MHDVLTNHDLIACQPVEVNCDSRRKRSASIQPGADVAGANAGLCVCESYIGKPIGTRAVPQFTTGVAKPLTQIEPGKTEHHPPV